MEPVRYAGGGKVIVSQLGAQRQGEAALMACPRETNRLLREADDHHDEQDQQHGAGEDHHHLQVERNAEHLRFENRRRQNEERKGIQERVGAEAVADGIQCFCGAADGNSERGHAKLRFTHQPLSFQQAMAIKAPR